MSYFTVKELPEGDRPREKLLKYGAEALTDSELLAILLRTGVKGKNVLDLSREILNSFGGVPGLSKVHVRELVDFKGLGCAKAVAVKAALELGRRSLTAEELSSISSSRDAYSFLRRYSYLEVEVFGLLTLDSKNRVLGVYEVSKGSVNSTVITPREVFLPAVRDLAVSIILFHNHPSGDLSPSPEDLFVTKRIQEAGRVLGIDVLDHIILSKRGYFSFKEEGIF